MGCAPKSGTAKEIVAILTKLGFWAAIDPQEIVVY